MRPKNHTDRNINVTEISQLDISPPVFYTRDVIVFVGAKKS